MKVAGQLFGQNSTQSSLASATAQITAVEQLEVVLNVLYMAF